VRDRMSRERSKDLLRGALRRDEQAEAGVLHVFGGAGIPSPAMSPHSTTSLSVSRRGLGSAIAEECATLARHRWLVWELVKREHADRYAGSFFGSLWAIGHPLLLMAVYVVVFSYVFRLKLGGTVEMPLDYTAYLMAGYLPWMALQESSLKAASAITGH